MDDATLKRWFCEEILPMEAGLTRYLHRNWRSSDDVPDLRQDVYEAVLKAATVQKPTNATAYLFTTARNHLINRAKRGKVISFELVADFDNVHVDPDFNAAHRHLDARDALRRVAAGMAGLPPRCREVVRLRKIEGLSTRQAAERMGVSTETIERQLVLGLRAMDDAAVGGTGRIRRSSQPKTGRKADR